MRVCLPLLSLVVLTWSAPAAASPLNPWGVHVGKKVFAITPFVYAGYDGGAWINPLIYAQYGFTDRFELLAGVGAGIYPGSTPLGGLETIELMPRQFFSDTSGMALHLTYNVGSGLDAAPEFHGVYELGPITLTMNIGGTVGFGLTSTGGLLLGGDVYALLAPEYYFNDATSVFLEVNPSYDLTDLGGSTAFSLELVPGVSTALAETHYFAFGVAIPVTNFDPAGIYGGMWYSTSFGGEE